ncbi:iron-containing alcohol dehydrogenase family protein [Desulfovibrio falkowii]|uniref:Iron-containing alcohol dehydrogenase family protein n=1 Tax=Desulfovibrio falkowii TaxID=3136602 RepID=A0ABQ0ECU2_9BACT
MYRNAKNVGYYMIGQGSLSHLGDLMAPRRKAVSGPAVFFLDHFFQGKDLAGKLPVESGDMVLYIDTTGEPTTDSVDGYTAQVKTFLNGAEPCALVALGGGCVLDTCKCVGNLLTNPGKAEDYQGWDLVKNPAPYKIAVPTLSGTGSETSRTGIICNEEKNIKLGMNSDFTMFDQVLMDPDLTASVPRNQYFYTGIDTYMHCFESITGSYRNVVVDSLAEKAIDLCKQIFLSQDMMSEENREKMMIASYLGGMAAGFVGVVHPISAGLSMVLHMRHGIANCYSLSVQEDIYPEQYKEFMLMMERQGIDLPKGICQGLTDAQYDALYGASIVHEKPLSNRLGPDFKKILTKENVIGRFRSM